MKIRRLQLNGLTTLFIFLLFAAGAVSAQTYSGQAFAGGVTIDAVGQPVVTSNVLDTGALPATGGGPISQSSVGLYTLPGGVLTLGDRTVSTSGLGNSSLSSASVNSLDLGALGFSNLVTASAVSSQTSATCSGEVLSGSSTLVDLVVDGTPITVTGDANQTVTIDLGSSRVLTVIINEQIVQPRSITVNALHVTVSDPLGLQTEVDVIVASSRSGINCLISPVSDLYSGRGTAVRVDQNSLLIPSLTTLIADTGWLPTPGTAPQPPIESTTAGAGLLGVLTTGTAFSSTEGGDPVGTTESSSQVQDLDIGIANPLFPLLGPANILTLAADVVESDTICQCSTGTPTCTGDSNIVGLTATALGIPVTIPLDFPPNTVLIDVSVPLVASVRIVANEQSSTSSGTFADINVNALAIEVSALDALIADTDIAIAQSHSDINCSLAPSSAPVSLRGRVFDRSGRGLTGARVIISDGEGFSQIASTSTFGQYAFKGLPSGRVYFVSVSARGYIFSTQTVTLDDSLSGFDLYPNSGRFETGKRAGPTKR